MEKLLELILAELRITNQLLQQPQAAARECITLPDRAVSERDALFMDRINTPVEVLKTTFNRGCNEQQPVPPPLPTAVRIKWTPTMEAFIHTCADATPGTYRNSVRFLTDKLKNVPLTAIRNKANKLGYKIKSSYLHKKDN